MKVLNLIQRLIITLIKGINYIDRAKIRVKFDGSCLKQEKMTFTHEKWLTYIYLKSA